VVTFGSAGVTGCEGRGVEGRVLAEDCAAGGGELVEFDDAPVTTGAARSRVGLLEPPVASTMAMPTPMIAMTAAATPPISQREGSEPCSCWGGIA
jgi:hypothetical protein